MRGGKVRGGKVRGGKVRGGKVSLFSSHPLRPAYTGRLPADLSHATRINMGKSSVIV